MTRLHRSLPVSWWHVIVALERHGYTHGAIAAAIGSCRSTVAGWKNSGASPAHDIGECLIQLWQTVTGNTREDVPRQQGYLSAAKVSRPAPRPVSSGRQPEPLRLLI